ncbi:MAG: DUF86 domain-containing protein [Hymenobacteraceae bacterium]|nr:DUF86 domain-containing protein [Hymenobacteraceae bacterium]
MRDTPTLADYLADQKTRDAIARQLGIIGEAVNHYRREADSPVLTNMVAIVRFRNLLIHAYDSVNAYDVWAILHRHLPLLRAEADALLQTDDS